MSNIIEIEKIHKKFSVLIKSITLFSIIIFAFLAINFLAYAETSIDFSTDVKNGLDAANQSGPNSSVQVIKMQDYKSAWDEFGVNSIIDGENAPVVIQQRVVGDIVNDLQTQLSYDQKDEQYLKLRNSSPEDVMAAEDAGGSDVLPQNYIEPHPSLDANPDVNPSVVDIFIATDTLDIVPSTDIYTTDVPLIDNATTSESTTTSDTLIQFDQAIIDNTGDQTSNTDSSSNVSSSNTTDASSTTATDAIYSTSTDTIYSTTTDSTSSTDIIIPEVPQVDASQI